MTLFDLERSEPTAPSGPSVRVRLLVAYDGSRYRGFAPSAGVETVGGALADAIGVVLRQPVKLTCAGRTDAGVHAWGQVVTFDAVGKVDVDQLTRAVTKMLGPDIVVRDAAVVDEGFDARRSARARRYRYTVLNRVTPDPFLAPVAWHVEEPLDLRSMQAACDPLIGEHDFSSFCRRPPGDGDASLVRRVRLASWAAVGDDLLRFSIEANAFCHQMVRSVVGMMVEVGRGRIRPGEVSGIVRARSRAAVGQLAPPHGLCLWEVVYT